MAALFFKWKIKTHLHVIPLAHLYTKHHSSNHRVHILVEMKQGQCICPLSWSVHCNFTGYGKFNKGGGRAPPTLTSQGQFYPHDWMYARKQQLQLCVLCGSNYYIRYCTVHDISPTTESCYCRRFDTVYCSTVRMKETTVIKNQYLREYVP
jgi:hypothetical protein